MLGYVPLAGLFLVNLWGRPHYQFFPLALMGAAFLGWTRLKEVPRPFVGEGGWVSITFSGCLVPPLVGSDVLLVSLGGQHRGVYGAAGVVLAARRQGFAEAMLPALLLVLVIIPPPLSADTRLIQHMRVLAVRWSSQFLDILGVIHALSGNVIELPGSSCWWTRHAAALTRC